MIGKADALQLVFCCLSAKGIEQERQQRRSAYQQLGGQSVFHCGLENGGN